MPMRSVVAIPPSSLWEHLPAALDGSGPALLPDGPASLTGPLAPDEDSAADPTAIVVATSGSTGEPKGVLLSASALMASATATHARLGGPGRWLLATPARYIGGIQVVVRSLLAGHPPMTLDLSAGFHVAEFVQAASKLLATPGRHYTALVPTQLARLLAGQAHEVLSALDGIILGGAPMTAELRHAASGLPVISAYGMSETASGCVYDGIPLDGVSVRLRDDRVAISGPVLARGYRGRPDLTAESFSDGWFTTSDLGKFTDGKLEILGRADDVINTGGVKVPASAVERSLERRVAAACVVGLDDPEWGQIVAAAVVSDDADLDSLRDHVRAELGAPAVPKVLRVIDELPLRGPGKVDRAAVRAYLTRLPS
jgi:O-succinylbenzoic acid--CoA ligase